MGFILVHFDEISRTAGFEEMGRINVELGECGYCFLLSEARCPTGRKGY